MTNVYICDDVKAVQKLHEAVFADNFSTLSVQEQLNRQAQRLLTGHHEKDPAVLIHLRSWFPGSDDKPTWQLSTEELFGLELTLADARFTMAREYGFRDWAHVKAEGSAPPDPFFERAVDAVVAGEMAALTQGLAERPSLISQHSDYGHRSTLLHYVGANGVETHRQQTPLNLADVTRLLLDAGADVNAEAEMYGGGSTVLGLLMSSAHPAEAGVTDEVAAILKEAGAR